jgi:UDP-N-acetylglucosamine--N-acetylmuramyl-(pentapeptide) pyrophosphoryl-undecaprenol N-acetylglucosamine transferase
VKRVLIAGGGTGGHVYPGLAVAQVLKKRYRDIEITFVGTQRGLEARVVPQEGYGLQLLPVRGLPRKFGKDQVAALFAFARSLFVTWRFFLRWRPEIVLGTGGYVSAPPLVIGRLLRIPIVLQEQNAIPGAVNRWLSRIADQVHINFAGARRYFSRRDNLRLTGNPLRPGLLAGSRQHAYRKFGLSPGARTIVAVGGSHGAHSINEAMADAIGKLPAKLGIQFVLQTGKRDAGWMRRRLQGCPFRVSVHAYLNKVDQAYSVADLVVCRAGAMTLSEITACGLPSILVPYPYATHGHQVENAGELVDRDAAVMILDADLTGERLAREIKDLLDDSTRLRQMATNAHGSARFDGAEKLADALSTLADPRSETMTESRDRWSDLPPAQSDTSEPRRRRSGRSGRRRRGRNGGSGQGRRQGGTQTQRRNEGTGGSRRGNPRARRES